MEDRTEGRLSFPRQGRERGLRDDRQCADAAGDDRVEAGDCQGVAMRLMLAAGVLMLAFGVTAVAQKPHAPVPLDATRQLPKNFTREFENEWVNVTRAHYDANSTLPAHEHQGGISVYLYLNASDGVVY